MKKTITSLYVFTLFSIIPLQMASADYIVSDYSGCTNCLVTDDVTNLQWLSPIYTAGISYNEISAGWGNLIVSEGFSIATAEQASNLFLGFGLSPIGAWLPAVDLSIDNFFGVFDPLYEYGGDRRYRSLVGFVLSDLTPKAYLASVFQDRLGNDAGGEYLSYSAHDPYSFEKDITNPNWGTWLVRDTNPVPEPSTLFLLAFGILFFLIKSRCANKNP